MKRKRRWTVSEFYKGKLLHDLQEVQEAAAQLPPLKQIKETESLNSIVSAKTYPSLALWLKSKQTSPFLRKLIEQAYQKEKEHSEP